MSLRSTPSYWRAGLRPEEALVIDSVRCRVGMLLASARGGAWCLAGDEEHIVPLRGTRVIFMFRTAEPTRLAIATHEGWRYA